MTQHIIALCLAFVLDLIIGDPQNFPHIIRFIGNLISALEKLLRGIFPKTDRGEFIAGFFLVVLTLVIPTAITIAILKLCAMVHIYLALAVESLICYQMLATKCLKDASMQVYHELVQGDIKSARYAVSMIVGRDTAHLDETAVAKATVETVAENFSDGVLAPMIFMAIGGAPAGIFYKAANTMDSMVGYKNDKYMFFGRVAAIFDDVLNFIPARLGGIVMSISAVFVGQDSGNAFRIFFRDRLKHKSPNSAHTEAATAGALHVELAGDNYYFGKIVSKPTIGDADRAVVTEDIMAVNRLMYASAVVSMAIIIAITFILR